MALNDDYVVDILLESGLITKTQVQEAREQAEGGSVSEALVRSGAVTHEDISRTLAANSGMEFADLSQHTIPPNITGILTPMDARRYQAIPLSERDGAVTIAIADPMAFENFDALGFLLKREVEFVCTTPEQLEKALDQYYGPAEGDTLPGEGFDVTDDGGEGDAPIIKMVTTLLLEAYKMKASDIHLEPLERSFRVRFRIDGVLQEMQSPPKKLQTAIVARIKIMTNTMSIAEKRLPQDGRIQVKIGKAAVDLRVSTIPTVHGESVVMRILDKSSLTLGLPELGFLSDDQDVFERLITLPDGILLVTGPTGSGKTTTLYACLHHINKPDRKIITVEEPIEYQMTGINQVQVNTEIGM
ncbi:MAG TPA: ATPase, T2SS/T4P/T4SS family, partial [Chthoniobacterales bacterium]|nr:ATPase, T2SS/T4P/T4SS family [Chthoniobacterales bacterium]